MAVCRYLEVDPSGQERYRTVGLPSVRQGSAWIAKRAHVGRLGRDLEAPIHYSHLDTYILTSI